MTFQDQERRLDHQLRVQEFSADEAWSLGSLMRTLAVERGLPMVIRITIGEVTAFHVALPGAVVSSEQALASKTQVALHRGAFVERIHEQHRQSVANDHLDFGSDPYWLSPRGGVVLIRNRDGSVIGTIGASGLHHLDDHRFVLFCLRSWRRDLAVKRRQVKIREMGPANPDSAECQATDAC